MGDKEVARFAVLAVPHFVAFTIKDANGELIKELATGRTVLVRAFHDFVVIGAIATEAHAIELILFAKGATFKKREVPAM